MITPKIEFIKIIRAFSGGQIGLVNAKLIIDTYFRIRGLEKTAPTMDIDAQGMLEIGRLVGAISSGRVVIDNGQFVFGKPLVLTDEDVAKICTNW